MAEQAPADPAAEAIQKWLASAPPEVKRLLTIREAGKEGKTTKRDANYRPADGPESCANCAHYDGERSCDVVSGGIDPGHVSDLYEPVDQGGQGDQ